MALVGQAEAAHDAAAALHQFLEHVPDHDAELTALISELYAVSSALRGLSTTIVELQHTGAYGRISAEVGITLESMVHTFGDFNRLLGGFARYRHLSNRAAHGQVWDDIDEYFHVQSNCPFKKRLQYYKSYLLQMEHVIEQGYVPGRRSDWIGALIRTVIPSTKRITWTSGIASRPCSKNRTGRRTWGSGTFRLDRPVGPRSRFPPPSEC